ncbi:MAG: CRISPR-associated endonuclease Cas1 [Candidatus Aminicenantes bacterium]|nr:CRISPR-associated endonuclease Cas1 [Candidatus Aminicenantes bacterium]
MGRTLYLSETERFKALADGPSIWIDWANKASQRIPLRLISRCIIIGNISIDTELISLLANHNIPIIFTNSSGYELAITLPYNHRLPKHWKEQKVFLESKKNRERYLCWVKLKRMTLQLKVLKKLMPRKSGQLSFDIGEGDYQIYLKPFKPKNEELWRVVKNFINNLMRGIIIEKINQVGLNLNQGIMHRYHNFGLVLDIGYILEPVIDEQSLQFFKQKSFLPLLEKKGNNWSLTKEGLKSIIHRFENKKEEVESSLDNILDEFFDLMRELGS